jgi:malonyl-ACP O-methyltransferase BioC
MTHSLKEKIKYRFNKAYRTYDQNCFIQDYIAKQSVALLCRHSKNFCNISDFACGTGQSTIALINNVNYKKCYAIDFAQKLLSIARNKITNSNVKFILSDIDTYIFEHKYLDLIFCNMGLQWLPNISYTLKILNYYLSTKGLLAFSIPNRDNFPELKVQHKNTMPSTEKLKSLLYSSGYKIKEYRTFSYTLKFPDTYQAIRSIKNTGANCTMNNQHFQKNVTRINTDSFFSKPSVPSLTYVIDVYICEGDNK